MDKYKIFSSSSIEVLKDEQLIGGANSYKEVCKIIQEYLAINQFYQEPYWRFLLGENATFIDYGSWSRFIAIIPPISMSDIESEN